MAHNAQHKMRTLSLAVPDELRDAVFERAQREDRSVSSLVRRELRRFLERCAELDREREEAA